MTRLSPWTLLPVGTIVAACSLLAASQPTVAAGDHAPANPSGNDAACAACHRAIYDRYRSTPMANASGAAVDGLIPGVFEHAPSGVEYRVFLQGARAMLSYRRPAGAAQEPLSGQRQLVYFIGSGHRGRTYLYQEAGLWFEAPINYYSRKGVWDMAPNYGASHTMPDGLPVDPGCLHCHVSGVQPSLPVARNRFAGAPFTGSGLGCSSCHGDSAEHLAHPQGGTITNPAKLSAARRDSVCLQCHLEGDAAINRAGRSLAGFRPGDSLADFVTYFVKADAEGGGRRAASQYEALLRSACKRASGDRLTCTTCHDPHGTPTEAERVTYFRSRCLSCHTSPKIAVEHHPEQKDCAVCHMPSLKTTDISHEQITDHGIRRTPSTAALKLGTLGEPGFRLVPVGELQAGDRETGLAYAQAAQHGNREALTQGLQYLRRAAATGAEDAAVHTQLGLLDQIAGELPQALTEYDRALVLDPDNATALGNKAVLEATHGNAEEAIRLLDHVLRNDPSQVTAGLNLAFLQCSLGHKDDARVTLNRLLPFSPDDPAVRSFLRDGTYAGRRCSLAADAGAKPSQERP